MTKHPNVLVNAWCYALYEMRACLALRLFLLSRCRRIVEELGGNPHVLLFFEKYSKVYRDPGSWEPKPFHLNPKNERTTPCNGLDDAEFYASSSSAGDNWMASFPLPLSVLCLFLFSVLFYVFWRRKDITIAWSNLHFFDWLSPFISFGFWEVQKSQILDRRAGCSGVCRHLALANQVLRPDQSQYLGQWTHSFSLELGDIYLLAVGCGFAFECCMDVSTEG